MIIYFSSPQNSTGFSSSPDSASLRFGVKRPRVKKAHVTKTAAVPKPKSDTVALKGTQKRKAGVSVATLWESIERAKLSGDSNDLLILESQLKGSIRDDGADRQKQKLTDGIMRTIRTYSWDVLKKGGKTVLDLDGHRNHQFSPSASKANSLEPSGLKNVEASQPEVPIVDSHGTNRSSLAPTAASQPVFPTQNRRESNASSNVFFSNQRGLDGFPEFTMPDRHEPIVSPSYALHGQSPFLGSIDPHGAFPDTFEEQFALTQGDIPAPASNKSWHLSDLVEGSIIRSNRSATKVATNLLKGEIKEEFSAKLAKYARIARNKNKKCLSTRMLNVVLACE